ncbi:hypothetical protein GWI33_012134, partial [Rhynchophorus ferrugineus]
VVNPKLQEIAARSGGYGGNKQNKWGYGGGFRGRENNGARQHTRFSNNTNGVKSAGGYGKTNGTTNGYGNKMNGNSKGYGKSSDY